MFTSKYILAVFAVVSSVTAAALDTRQTTPSVILCTGALVPSGGGGCVTVPVQLDACRSFTGGFDFLEGQLSNARIPSGLICTFFSATGCVSTSSKVLLTAGDWDFTKVTGTTGGTINFNDMASSFSCSTL